MKRIPMILGAVIVIGGALMSAGRGQSTNTILQKPASRPTRGRPS